MSGQTPTMLATNSTSDGACSSYVVVARQRRDRDIIKSLYSALFKQVTIISVRGKGPSCYSLKTSPQQSQIKVRVVNESLFVPAVQKLHIRLRENVRPSGNATSDAELPTAVTMDPAIDSSWVVSLSNLSGTPVATRRNLSHLKSVGILRWPDHALRTTDHKVGGPSFI